MQDEISLFLDKQTRRLQVLNNYVIIHWYDGATRVGSIRFNFDIHNPNRSIGSCLNVHYDGRMHHFCNATWSLYLGLEE